jgi:hypothetical protein
MASRGPLFVSRVALRVLIWITAAVIALVAAALAFSFMPAGERAVRHHFGGDPAGGLAALRLLLLLLLAMLPLGHLVLRRLLAVVETVRAGDPFVAENAGRLRRIAWALLAVQLLYMPFQALGYRLVSRSAEIRFDVPMIGLLVILLLFVLAQVFAEGTRIRDDLKAMI